MKKLMYFAAALLAFAACSKEVEVAVEDTAAVSTYPVSIKAGLADETKTAYEGEKVFSWVAGDKIAMMVTNNETGVPDVITLTAEADGPVTTFTGDCPEGWTLADYAFYPKGTGDSYYSSDLGKVVDTENKVMNLRMWGTITPDLENPMASIPLIGKMDNSGFVQFRTATGILKVTVADIPADAYFLQLDIDNGTVALNGNYSFGEDCTIYMKNVIGTAWGQKYVKFTPAEAGETRTFYIPIPVGKIPAGMKVSLATNSGNILLAETKEAIEIKRNTIVNTPALTVPAEEWKTIGTGKFMDKFIWSFAGLTDFVEVEFQQSARYQSMYRLVKPYPGENSDPYFVFDIADETKVKSDNYFVDVEVNKGEGKPNFKPWVRNGVDYGYNFSDVTYHQENGLPGSIEIAPCYRGEEFSAGDSANYDYEIGKDHERFAIEIVFPGCEPYAVHGPDLEPNQIWIQESQITVNSNASYNSGANNYDGIGKAGLVDGNTSTYWHSAYYDAYDYPTSTSFDPKYGITIDIALKEELKDFSISYYTRHNNNNGEPREIILACSNDGTTWTDIQTIADDELMKVAKGVRVDLPAVSAAAAFKYLRIGITKAGNGDTPSNLTVANGGSTAIGELLLFNVGNVVPVTVDVLNNAFTGVEGTNYADWTNTGATGAVYVGQSAGDASTIQLRSDPTKASAGIVTVRSAGVVKKVAVKWNDNKTSANRFLDVFVKNTPYEAVTDQDDPEKRGTFVGSFDRLAKGADLEQEMEIPGNYAYVLLRAADGAIYMDEISITWDIEGVPADPDPVVSSYTWDFGSEAWQAKFAEVAAAGTDTYCWKINYDGLWLVSHNKSKYNAGYFQWGGKGTNRDRWIEFTAPKDGFILANVSNTGSSEDQTRKLVVVNGGTTQSEPGGFVSTEPQNIILPVKAGKVWMYSDGNALRFYKVLFSETDPTPEEPGSGVPDYDPITGFEW